MAVMFLIHLNFENTVTILTLIILLVITKRGHNPSDSSICLIEYMNFNIQKWNPSKPNYLLDNTFLSRCRYCYR